MSLWLHGKEDYISEAGAMNMWIIKQASDGCTFILYLNLSPFPFPNIHSFSASPELALTFLSFLIYSM